MTDEQVDGFDPQQADPRQTFYQQDTPQPGQMLKPHRGTLVLVLGILSISFGVIGPLVCVALAPVGLTLGLVALLTAASDLRMMTKHVMDPTGYSITRAGRICGLIGTIISIPLAILIIVIALIFIIGSFPGGPM